MALRIEDVPALDTAGRLGRHLPDPTLADAYHDVSTPSVASQVASLGVALGLRAMRALQEKFLTSDQDMVALSHGGPAPQYTTWPDCSSHNDTAFCSDPCIGAPAHHMLTAYCATCDEQAADPTHNPPWNWHFTGSRGSLEYGDFQPNICGPSPGRDAWKWKIDLAANNSTCRGCSESIVFRCHDGWKKYSADGPPHLTICEGIISCDNELTLCP